MKKAILLVLILIAISTFPTAQAAYIPPEYKVAADEYIHNDVQLYLFSSQYQGQQWADDTIMRLADKYTNFGYNMRGVQVLKIKMNAIAKRMGYI